MKDKKYRENICNRAQNKGWMSIDFMMAGLNVSGINALVHYLRKRHARIKQFSWSFNWQLKIHVKNIRD